MIFKNGRVFTENGIFENKDVVIEGNKITKIGENLSYDGEVYDLKGKKLLPGFIDIHTHGCGGADFCDAGLESFEKMAETYIKFGVTTAMTTSMTISKDDLRKSFSVYKEFADNQGTRGTRLAGINMEGPFLSIPKKGAHIEEYVIPGDFEFFKELFELSGNRIKIVDVAPEVEGNLDFIEKAKDLATVSVAHTDGSYEVCMEAYKRGATNTTHLYNAMTPFSHRAPGAVGAAYDSDAFVEIICDGFHVLPPALRTSFKIFGDDRICIISDSMRASGMPEGVYDLGGQDVYVKDGIAALANGVIAGSVANSHIGIKNLLEFGIKEESVIKAATINPARAIKMDDEIGSIREGKLADLVIVDDDYNIEAVYRDGVKQTI